MPIGGLRDGLPPHPDSLHCADGTKLAICGGSAKMKRELSGPCLSAVFVDYDNIYLSLKRKSEDAAKKFAKDGLSWLREIESGRLITLTNGPAADVERRIVMSRCYGNPVPRRNSQDNSTDMNSFPFVRHHFLRAGFEIIDCPPLTAQLKNSSDIRMVMDIRDFLTHDTYFDEFIILSGDADFTPVLHRLRAHARRTIIFANDYTAAPYTAISDGEVRESDLVALLATGHLPGDAEPNNAQTEMVDEAALDATRVEILNEIISGVMTAAAPVPIEALADRALRSLGHDKTIGTSWGGYGSFRSFLQVNLPEEIKLTEQAPYFAYDPSRHLLPETDMPAQPLERAPAALGGGAPIMPNAATAPDPATLQGAGRPAGSPIDFGGAAAAAQPVQQVQPVAQAQPQAQAAPAPAVAANTAEQPSLMQQSIARIHDASQAPPLAPPEYRKLFEAMAAELAENGLSGAQTVTNITQRAQQQDLDLRRDDVRFVLEVVSEADPWFEQGVSANLFAGRFRNFVVARCRGQGLNLTADELDLIDAWFAGGQHAQPLPQQSGAIFEGLTQNTSDVDGESQVVAVNGNLEGADRQWADAPTQTRAGGAPRMSAVSGQGDEEFPRILRTQRSG